MKNTIHSIVSATVAVAIPCAALAQEAAPLEPAGGNPWHVSIGYEYRPSVKAKFQFAPTRYSAGQAMALSPAFQSQGSAQSAAANGDYDDGYVHPDAGTANNGSTTAWSANDDSQYSAADETITFSSKYGTSSSSLLAPTPAAGEEKENISGFTLDLSRQVWSQGSFSLNAALGFSYLPKKDIVDFTHAFSLGSASTGVRTITAAYDVSYWAGNVPPTLNNQGGGQTGAQIPAQPASTTDSAASGGSSATYNGGADLAVEFEMMELRLALEPEWIISDWLSAFGQLGVAVGQGKAAWDTSSWFSGNGSRRDYSSSGEDKDTFFQGLAGVGLRIMPIENLGICIFGDARLGKGEVEVDASPYAGKIETGLLRAGVAITAAF